MVKSFLQTALDWLHAHPYSRWVYPICMFLTILAMALAPRTGIAILCLFLGCSIMLLYACRPMSWLHRITMEKNGFLKHYFTGFVVFCTLYACVAPMDNLKLWNGTIPGHRNQYELLTESILDGRIDIEYGDETALLELENPYDPDERHAKGVPYHWDHAYYKGHYYMYFGVVPVFLVFLPYRLLTGSTLLTCHATQIFAIVAIIGIFFLFHLLSKLFFKKLPYTVYLLLSVAFSAISIFHCTAAPSLYCTAIMSAIALEIWSLYFFVYAVWKETRENRQILLAAVGALLGALVFGCRPPIGFANLLVLPMLFVFLKQRKITAKLIGKLVLAALPYVVIGIALMVYNYARFENPFEFGQSYQLTIADQSQYGVTLSLATLLQLLRGTIENFFKIGTFSNAFPYIFPSSVFFNFPILLLWIGMFRPDVRSSLKKNNLLPLLGWTLLTVFIISAMDILWSPFLLERYRMDLYFLLCIGCFIVIGHRYSLCSEKGQARYRASIAVLSYITVICAALFCAYIISKDTPSHISKIFVLFGLHN